MAKMTKQNIEAAIRSYLMQHLDLIPEASRKGLFDIDLTVRLSDDFSYVGADHYYFAGFGDGWMSPEAGGKISKRFNIKPTLAHVSGDEEPIVKIENPVFIEILP